MKNFTKIIAVAVFVVLSANLATAQDWSKEQTEVWQVVKDTWKAWQGGNSTAIAAALHEKYQGWSDQTPLPTGKQETIDWYNSMKDNIKVPNYNIQPARIVVLKSAAVVDYYYEMTVSWAMGTDVGTEKVTGKVAEFYVKEGDKWQLLGDMMMHDDAEDDD
jgi:hypothetical protein